MTRFLLTILAVSESDGPVSPSNVGLGSVVLTLAVALFLAWVGYLIVASRRRRRKPEVTPKNLQPYLSDDELEVSRLTRVLGAAVISAAVLAIVLPVYYIQESDRQAEAAESFREADVEEGERWWEKFSCTVCHAPDASGGGANFAERRSGLEVTWTAPSLNDVFLRFGQDEVREIITFGREGTPMAPAGLEGGGAMTDQELDQVLAFIGHLQVNQGDALSKIQGIVDRALSRIVEGSATVENLIAIQEAEAEEIEDAPVMLETHAAFLAGSSDFVEAIAINPRLRLNEAVRILISGDGACTDDSAAIAGFACDAPGADTDRDGIADAAEGSLTAIAEQAYMTITTRSVNRANEIVVVQDEQYNVSFDPETGFSNIGVTGAAIADLDELDSLLTSLDTDILLLSVIAERRDSFMAGVEEGLVFLRTSRDEKRWIPEGVTVTVEDDVAVADYSSLASGLEMTTEEATRAVGLFNGYCARCHTAGYSAGVGFERTLGSGAWAPALTDGRTLVQFPDVADHETFVIKGTDFGARYGVNGLGTGRMPGFGQILSLDDIQLIIRYERSL